MIILTVIALVFGLIFGSFYNVCISRIPKGKSIVYPASHCPSCKHDLPWYHNIPLVSYLALRGRCGFCGLGIGVVYPIIEGLTGLMTVLVLRRSIFLFGADWMPIFVIYFIFSSGLLILSVIDLRYLIIPDRFTKGGVLVGIVLAYLVPRMHGWENPIDGLIYASVSAGICYALLEGIRVLGRWFYKREAMGYGDVKLFAAFGAFLGWPMAFLAIFFAALLGSMIGLFSILFRHLHLKSEIPFGPYLAMGAFMTILFGQETLAWYLQRALIYG